MRASRVRRYGWQVAGCARRAQQILVVLRNWATGTMLPPAHARRSHHIPPGHLKAEPRWGLVVLVFVVFPPPGGGTVQISASSCLLALQPSRASLQLHFPILRSRCCLCSTLCSISHHTHKPFLDLLCFSSVCPQVRDVLFTAGHSAARHSARHGHALPRANPQAEQHRRLPDPAVTSHRLHLMCQR